MRALIVASTLTLLSLSGCSDSEPAASPSPAMSSPAAPSPEPSISQSAVGEVKFYTDSDGALILRLNPDGTFEFEDEAKEIMRDGSYVIDGDVIVLTGSDGQVDEGTIDEQQVSLPFALLFKQ